MKTWIFASAKSTIFPFIQIFFTCSKLITASGSRSYPKVSKIRTRESGRIDQSRERDDHGRFEAEDSGTESEKDRGFLCE